MHRNPHVDRLLSFLIVIGGATPLAAGEIAPPRAPHTVTRFDECPIILQLRSGSLMGIYLRSAPDGQSVMARTSTDGGTDWSEPRALLQLSWEPGGWGGHIALVDRDGRIHLFLLNDAHTGVIRTGEDQRVKAGQMGPHRLDIWHASSADDGRTWKPPRAIWKGYTGALNSVVQLRSGRILLPFSYLTKRTWSNRGKELDAFTFTGQYDCTLVYSDDAGENWQLSPSSLSTVVPDIVSAYGAVEPVVIELRDGRVWMLLRTQQGRFYESFSKDGAEWSRPRPTAIIASDSPAGLLRISDGRIMLFWNSCLRFPYAYGGRHVLHAALSDDEGRTWRGCREVARDPYRDQPPPPSGDHGPSYPYPAVSRDGSVFFTTGVATGSGRSVVRLDPRWLDDTAQSTDFSSGLDDWSIFGTRGVERISDLDRANARILSIRRTSLDWPATAVWNFPARNRGTLNLRLRLRRGFAGVRVALTDHFSVPFDAEDVYNNVFQLEIGPEGDLRGATLLPERRYDLALQWDLDKRECRVRLDGAEVTMLPLRRESIALNYLRLASTAEETDDGGFLVQSVSVNVFPDKD